MKVGALIVTTLPFLLPVSLLLSLTLPPQLPPLTFNAAPLLIDAPTAVPGELSTPRLPPPPLTFNPQPLSLGSR